MRQNVFSSGKENVYEKLLAQATLTSPLVTFDSPEGRKGIFKLQDDVGRTFLLREVERKRRELNERDAGRSGSRGDFEQSY